MGPRELGNLIALIEWRFLRRPEALVFGLPEYQRADWLIAQQVLADRSEDVEDGGPEMEERWAREQRRQHARLRAKAEALEKEAHAAVALSPASQALLESRRAELEAFDPGSLERILRGIDPSLGTDAGWDQ